MLKKTAIVFSFLMCNHLLALTCSTPTTLSEPKIDALEPKITINKKGDAAVIWSASQGPNKTVVQIATKSPTSHWSHPETISSAVENISYPLAHIDASNQIHAVWNVEDNDGEWMGYTEKSSGKHWSQEKKLITLTDSNFISAHAFCNDRYLLIFEDEVPSPTSVFENDIIKVMSHSLKNADQKTVTLSDPAHDSEESFIKTTSNGTAFIAWLEEHDEDNNEDLKVSIQRSNQTWTNPELIYQFKDGFFIDLDLTINNQEDLGFIWNYSLTNDSIFAPEVIQVLTKANGKWAAPINLSNPKYDVFDPKIMVDDLGNFLAIWVAETDNNKCTLTAAYKPQGKPWLPPTEVTTYDKIRDPDIKIDNKGNFVVVWTQKRKKTTHAIYGASFSTKTKSWSATLQLSPEGLSCYTPSFAFDAQGKGFITWTTIHNVIETMVQVASLSAN